MSVFNCFPRKMEVLKKKAHYIKIGDKLQITRSKQSTFHEILYIP